MPTIAIIAESWARASRIPRDRYHGSRLAGTVSDVRKVHHRSTTHDNDRFADVLIVAEFREHRCDVVVVPGQWCRHGWRWAIDQI